jgi:hypothetical protein
MARSIVEVALVVWAAGVKAPGGPFMEWKVSVHAVTHQNRRSMWPTIIRG